MSGVPDCELQNIANNLEAVATATLEKCGFIRTNAHFHRIEGGWGMRYERAPKAVGDTWTSVWIAIREPTLARLTREVPDGHVSVRLEVRTTQEILGTPTGMSYSTEVERKSTYTLSSVLVSAEPFTNLLRENLLMAARMRPAAGGVCSTAS